MKYKNTLLAVTDMDNSVGFYKNVLGLRVVTDLGANKTLTGGLSLQTRESWAEFLGVSPDELCWCGRVGELYFEEDDETQTIQIVTTIRTDPGSGLISKESPLGRAVLGRKAGERVMVKVNEQYAYPVVIRTVQSAEDDGSAPILPF